MTIDRKAAARYALISVLAVPFAFPICLVVINAVKRQQDILADTLGIPLGRLTLDNLVHVATDPSIDMAGAYLTSALLTASTVFLTVGLASALGYVLARARNRLATACYVLLLAGLLVPPQVTLLPLVKLLAALHLMFTLPGLIAVEVASTLPLAVLLFAGFVRGLPIELEEAARVDGAGRFRVYVQIVMPLLRPATVTVAILVGVFIWNDYVNPAIILGPAGGNTVTTAINHAVGRFSTNFEQVYGALWLATVPLLLVFVILQRRLIAGLTEGAVRG